MRTRLGDVPEGSQDARTSPDAQVRHVSGGAAAGEEPDIIGQEASISRQPAISAIEIEVLQAQSD